MEDNFEVRTQGAIGKHQLDGVIGAGGPLFDLSTAEAPATLFLDPAMWRRLQPAASAFVPTLFAPGPKSVVETRRATAGRL